MANFQPLVYQELPQRLKTVLPENAPVGMRMAAAEGNLPLITQDLVTCLYYLSSDDDPRVRRSARKHLRELPETILRRALLAEISPKILDWFASVDLSPQELYELIILNKGTPDSAYIEMAKRVKDTRVLQLLARNEQRFLRNPRILAALRANPHLSAEVREWSKDFFRRHTGKDLEDVLSPDEILEIIRDVPDAVIGEVDMAPPPEAVAPGAVAPEAATPEAVAHEAEGAPEAVEDRQVAPAPAAPTIEVIQIPDPNAEFFANIQPLRWEQLSPRLQTVVPEDAAKSIRMAVAKSNLPLETVDLVMGMFYVAFDADPEVRVAARASLTELPASLLNTTLSTPMPAA
ncbi:hypothetical protein KDL45_07485, partial [bacterium]|nr:hypothetical protein [bacterium]